MSFLAASVSFLTSDRMSTTSTLPRFGASCKRPADQDPGCRPWPENFRRLQHLEHAENCVATHLQRVRGIWWIAKSRETHQKRSKLPQWMRSVRICSLARNQRYQSESDLRRCWKQKYNTVCIKAPLVRLQPLHLRHPPGVPILLQRLNVGSNLYCTVWQLCILHNLHIIFHCDRKFLQSPTACDCQNKGSSWKVIRSVPHKNELRRSWTWPLWPLQRLLSWPPEQTPSKEIRKVRETKGKERKGRTWHHKQKDF